MNHLYWSAVSTPDGDGEMILAKWLSVDNHIHNKTLGRALDPRANGTWLSKLTE